MGGCTAHGKQTSQVTIETRIVLTWTSIVEGGLTTSATIPLSRVRMFFAKRSVTKMDSKK